MPTQWSGVLPIVRTPFLESLKLPAGLDGFVAIENQILQRRMIYPSTRRGKPYGWEWDGETAAEVDRLLCWFSDALTQRASPGRPASCVFES